MHFSIEGEGFTDLIHQIVLSDEWEKAYNILIEGIKGNDIDKYARLIIDGKGYFDGNETDGLEFIEKENQDYIKQLKYIYAGRIKIDKCWWRPKKKVTSFDKNDMDYNFNKSKYNWEIDSLYDAGKNLVETIKNRVEYYSSEDDRVFPLQIKASHKKCGNRSCQICALRGVDFLIFEPTESVPFWWKRNKTTLQALEDLLSTGRQLEEDGANFRKLSVKDLYEDEYFIFFNEKYIEEKKEDIKTEEKEYKLYIEDLKQKVLNQANGDMISLSDEISVPRAPFLNWCLNRTSLKHLCPDWQIISPAGLKMPGDDPYHTDWAITVGLESAYKDPVKKLSFEKMIELQNSLGNFKSTVLVSGNKIHGTVGENIIVLPNLNPEHLEKIINAEAIITETGGQLCHLANISREKSIVIMLVEDACNKFPDKTELSISPDKGEIEIVFNID